MKIVIAGGTGFIGQTLTEHFLKDGHEVVIIGRDKNKINSLFNHRVIANDWEEFNDTGKDLVIGSDLIINLAGANIAEKRWSPARKKEIIQSRVFTTQKIAACCALLEDRSPPLFNASAVGIYGLQKTLDNVLPPALGEDEKIDFEKADDFVSEVVKAWEKATHIASAKNVRVVNMRFALVLGQKGLLKKLYTPFSLGLGGPVGEGNQPFPWIALDDLVNSIDFLIAHPAIKGPVNFVAPQCIPQQKFASTFGKVLHRPTFMKTPAFVIRTLFGEMGEELLLNGQCAYPKVLLSNGYKFSFTDIEAALKSIFKK